MSADLSVIDRASEQVRKDASDRMFHSTTSDLSARLMCRVDFRALTLLLAHHDGLMRALPTPIRGGREEIARIIDPFAWREPQPDEGWGWVPGKQEACQADAFVKADLVLALPASIGVGKEGLGADNCAASSPECGEGTLPSPTGWQPIETAPKRRMQLILAAYDYHPVRPAYWDGRCWVTICCVTEGGESPTHWMPLPAPPTLSSDARSSARPETGDA